VITYEVYRFLGTVEDNTNSAINSSRSFLDWEHYGKVYRYLELSS